MEDAAHGLGAELRGTPVGGASLRGLLQLLRDQEPARSAKAARSRPTTTSWPAYARTTRLHGLSRDAWRRYLPGGSWRYDVAEPGLKANITDIQAAIGRAQLACLPGWQQRRDVPRRAV